MYKKVLTSVLIVGVTSIATFASYSAVIDFAKTDLDAANSLAEKKIINDHKENPEKYNLESHVLRQEIAAVARGVAKLEKKEKCDNIFSDLSDTNPNGWACKNVEVLVDNDLISKNDTFRPEDKITKSETIAMLIKSIGFDYKLDKNSKKNWQEQVVFYAAQKGVVRYFTDFDTEATRGWVFKVADTTIKKDIEIKRKKAEAAAKKKLEEKKKYSDEAL